MVALQKTVPTGQAKYEAKVATKAPRLYAVSLTPLNGGFEYIKFMDTFICSEIINNKTRLKSSGLW